ncbi:MAG: lipopolysaccharide biosynthesis protein [Alphaproteobacteria bacterium]
MLAKFALMVYITRFIGLEAVGIFGLLQAANVIGTKAAGCGFSFVANRAIVDAPPPQQARIIRDQQIVYVIGYAVMILLSLLVYPWIPDQYRLYMMYSIILLIVGHQVLELGNILYGMHRVLAGNTIFALNNGLWAFVMIPLGLAFAEFRTLDAVIIGWLAGTVAAFLMGLWLIARLPFAEAVKQKPNWNWIKRGLWRGFPLYAASLAQHGSNYVDRYVVSGFVGLEYGGVFVMFWSFAYAVQVLVETGLLAGGMPKLVASYKSGDESEFWRRFRDLSAMMALAGAGFSLVAAALIHPVLSFINKPLAMENVGSFYLILLAFWIRFQAGASNAALYARHQDRTLTLAYWLNLVVASATNILFVWLWGLWGAALAQVVTAIFLSVFQAIFLWRLRHDRPKVLEDESSSPGLLV